MFDTPIRKFTVTEHSDGEGGTLEELDSNVLVWGDIIRDMTSATVLVQADEPIAVGDILVLPA